jgi:DNA repair exonuclease SbcCD ATPase subunit
MDSIGVQADEAHPFQFGNQGDNLGRDISPSNPNIGPVTQGMQEHMANNTLSGPVGGDASHLALPETATNMPANGAGALGEQPLDPQFQHGSLQENQANSSANNLVLDDLSLVRLVKELQRQQQLQQLQSQQLESRIQEQEHQSQQHETRNQQLETRISELERQQQLQQLQSQQQESRISELEGEVERLQSTEHARKRSCSGLTPRRNSEG